MKELSRKVIWTHFQIAAVSVFASATAVQYITGYFLKLGYSEMQMAAYGSAIGFSAFFTILTPLLVGKTRCYKKATLSIYIFAVVSFAMGAVLAFLLKDSSSAATPFIVIAFLFLWQTGMAMVAPALLSLLHGIVGNDRWPVFYGTRSMISAIASLAVSLAAGFYIGASPTFVSFLAVLMFGTAFGVLSIVSVGRFPAAPANEAAPKLSGYLKSLAAVLRDRVFVKILVTLVLRAFAYGLVYAFQTKYLLEELGMSYRSVYVWTAIGLGCAVLGYKLSAVVQKKTGSLNAYRWCLFLIIIDPILWMAASPQNLIPIYISMVIFGFAGVMGIVNAAYLTSHVGAVFDIATQENKSVYVSMTCLARGAAMVISPLIGGLLIKHMQGAASVRLFGFEGTGGYSIIFAAMLVLFTATALFSLSIEKKNMVKRTTLNGG